MRDADGSRDIESGELPTYYIDGTLPVDLNLFTALTKRDDGSLPRASPATPRSSTPSTT